MPLTPFVMLLLLALLTGALLSYPFAVLATKSRNQDLLKKNSEFWNGEVNWYREWNFQLVAELSQARSVQQDVLARVSHELRTPLTQIIGYCDLLTLLKAEQLDPEARQYLGQIEAAGWHLTALVDRLLCLHPEGEAEEGRTEEKIQTLAAEAARKEITLVLPVVPEGEILLPLLENAIKFTPVGGSVRVEREVLTDRVYLRVTDSGVGIREEDREKIWDPFWQAEPALRRVHGGLGLGLPALKRRMEEVGGAVEVESVPGETTFCVMLPRNPGCLSVAA